MSIGLDYGKRLARLGVGVMLLFEAGCAAPPQTAAVAPGPLAPGAARIWFYRVYDPSLSRNLANVDLNGARAVSVSPSGPPVFVDVAPGHYHIAPESYGADVNQTRDLDIAAGQTIYVKVLDDPTYMSSGDLSSFERDTFYVKLVPPAVAHAETALPM